MKWFINLALLVVGLAVSLILGECLVRILNPQKLIDADLALWQPDSQVKFRHKPNLDVVINCGEGPHRFMTDEFGYRINAMDKSAPGIQPDLSILTLGDSFLEAVSCNNEETIPSLLAQRLEEKYEWKFGR
jgi:hypothetical protein